MVLLVRCEFEVLNHFLDIVCTHDRGEPAPDRYHLDLPV